MAYSRVESAARGHTNAGFWADNTVGLWSCTTCVLHVAYAKSIHTPNATLAILPSCEMWIDSKIWYGFLMCVHGMFGCQRSEQWHWSRWRRLQPFDNRCKHDPTKLNSSRMSRMIKAQRTLRLFGQAKWVDWRKHIKYICVLRILNQIQDSGGDCFGMCVCLMIVGQRLDNFGW